jgi:hypothetical protein
MTTYGGNVPARSFYFTITKTAAPTVGSWSIGAVDNYGNRNGIGHTIQVSAGSYTWY